jgi:hypothetical protein
MLFIKTLTKKALNQKSRPEAAFKESGIGLVIGVWQQDLVNHVDHPIAGLNIYRDDTDTGIPGPIGDIGNIHPVIGSGQGNGNVVTLQRSRYGIARVGKVPGPNVSGNHMVQQHGSQ